MKLENLKANNSIEQFQERSNNVGRITMKDFIRRKEFIRGSESTAIIPDSEGIYKTEYTISIGKGKDWIDPKPDIIPIVIMSVVIITVALFILGMLGKIIQSP